MTGCWSASPRNLGFSFAYSGSSSSASSTVGGGGGVGARRGARPRASPTCTISILPFAPLYKRRSRSRGSGSSRKLLMARSRQRGGGAQTGKSRGGTGAPGALRGIPLTRGPASVSGLSGSCPPVANAGCRPVRRSCLAAPLGRIEARRGFMTWQDQRADCGRASRRREGR